MGLGTLNTLDKTSSEKCGEECDNNPECNSYEWGYASTGLCQLNKEDQPTETNDWQGDIFCKGLYNGILGFFIMTTLDMLYTTQAL